MGVYFKKIRVNLPLTNPVLNLLCEIVFKQGEKCIVNAFSSTDFKGVINLLNAIEK